MAILVPISGKTFWRKVEELKSLTGFFFLSTFLPQTAAYQSCRYLDLTFSCDTWDYCCGDSCCRSSNHFFRLWYFWFVIVLIILVCSAGGFWWRRRMLMRNSGIVYTNGTPAVVTYQVSTAYPHQQYPGAGSVTIVQGPPQVAGHYPGAAYNPPTQSMPYPVGGAPLGSFQTPPPAYNELYK